MIFVSILDQDYSQKLVAKRYSWIESRGGILWYDFIYNNASSLYVKRMGQKKVERLFKTNKIKHQKITLATPLARIVAKINPMFYHKLIQHIFLEHI